MQWQKISLEQPQEYTFAVASKGGVGCVLVEIEFEQVQIWSFAGGAWSRLKSFQLGEMSMSFDVLFDEDAQDFVIYFHNHNENVVRRFRLENPDELETLEHDVITNNDYPDSFSVAYHEAEQRPYLLYHNSLFRIDGTKLSPVCQNESLIYWTIEYDPHKQQIFASRASERSVQPIENGAIGFSDYTEEMGSNVIYSHARQALCALTRADSGDFSDFQLRTLEDGEWQPVDLHFDTKDALNVRFTLVADPDTGAIFAHGSLDDSAGGESYRVTIVEREGGFAALAAQEHYRAPQMTFSNSADALFLHDFSRDTSYRLESNNWRAIWPPADIDHDRKVLSMNATLCVGPDGTHYALNEEGAVYTRALDGQSPWRQIVDSANGPGGTHLNRKCIGWDPLQERVIVFGGYDDDRTFAVANGEWLELRSNHRPGLGLGSMACTSAGLFLACYGELWRLDGDNWICVAPIPEPEEVEDDFFKQSIRASLVHDPERDLLLATYLRDFDEMGVLGYFDLNEGAWKDLIKLPVEEAEVDKLGDLNVDLGLDPASDQLYIMGAGLAYKTEIELPRGGLPVVEAGSVQQLIDPPASALTPAWRLAKKSATQDPKTLELPLELPGDAEILALFPYHPKMGCRWFDALLFLQSFDESFTLQSPIEPIADYMNHIKIIPIEGWSQETPLFAFGYDEHLTESEWTPFDELAPQPSGKRIYKMTDNDRYADSTKLGGYARYFRRISGPEFDRISIQIESERAMNYIYLRLWDGGGQFDIEKR